MTYDVWFELGQRVRIKEAKDIVGVIDMISISSRGVRYEVIWWADGRRQEQFVNENELEEIS